VLGGSEGRERISHVGCSAGGGESSDQKGVQHSLRVKATPWISSAGSSRLLNQPRLRLRRKAATTMSSESVDMSVSFVPSGQSESVLIVKMHGDMCAIMAQLEPLELLQLRDQSGLKKNKTSNLGARPVFTVPR